MSSLILAGDVGGTKTWLGLFRPDRPRPTPVETRRYQTLEFDALAQIVALFLEQHGTSDRIAAACFGVAGPVQRNVATLTHVSWVIDGTDLATQLGLESAWLLNDLIATSHAVATLADSELACLQPGVRDDDSSVALIAPGTFLGEALLHRVEGRLRPAPSEGGHTDFAPRNPRELELARTRIASHGRIALEDVVSGHGLLNLFSFTHRSRACQAGLEVDGPPNMSLPSAISSAAMKNRCVACAETLDLFVSALGAAAGNLALRSVATAGVYIGGGIAPHILPWLQSGRFLDAFRDKGPMRPLLERTPVSVILRSDAALLGAAAYAHDRLPR
jgi:glucokinase